MLLYDNDRQLMVISEVTLPDILCHSQHIIILQLISKQRTLVKCSENLKYYNNLSLPPTLLNKYSITALTISFQKSFLVYKKYCVKKSRQCCCCVTVLYLLWELSFWAVLMKLMWQSLTVWWKLINNLSQPQQLHHWRHNSECLFFYIAFKAVN